MTPLRHRAPRPDPAPEEVASAHDRVASALADLREAVGDLLAAGRSGGAALAPRGVVILTDEGRGIARAVAADLRALGHPVVRVRHGVGGPEVEGVNLTAASAVAALIDRARGRGPLAAIVHAAPLREAPDPNRQPAWDDPDDARALALLAQAGAEDLTTSATRGGACLVVARRRPPGDQSAPSDRLARWVEISARSLTGVRVAALNLDPGDEPEVQAAEVVRAVLGTAPDGRVTPRADVEAFLLGAPDRAAWIHLAAALIDWLGENPGGSLADLAYTLHHEQPSYPFRVGLVATTGADLADRLSRVIGRLADPSCRSIHDPLMAYWNDTAGPSPPPARPRGRSWVHRLRGLEPAFESIPMDRGFSVEDASAWTAREWLCHLAASAFARGHRVNAGRLVAGRAVRKLDLTGSSLSSGETPPVVPPNSERGRLLVESLEALDDILSLRRAMVRALLTEAGGPS